MYADAIDAADLQEDLAYVEVLVGEPDAAVRRLAYLRTIPSGMRRFLFLRVDPMWDPLGGNPRFRRPVATPAP